ncbi:MAG: ABC transporter substrate-binding protein [Burkholderiaceae bacterium]|nr:ABC transporter substrate-binding protein [Burkholderiaceae bacterium]
MKATKLRWLLMCLALCLPLRLVQAADPAKVLRTAIAAAETGFDPVASHDLYSSQINASVFETLFTYDYLARPAKLVPLTAQSMPHISDGGKTWTIRLKKGIYFAPDPAFGSQRRELTMADYAYSLKRLIDPNLRSPWSWLVEGKIVGLDALARQAKTSGRFDYDAKIAGLEMPDRYTLRIRLNAPDYNLGQILAHTPTAAVAREAIEKYRDANGHAMANPVGTGPYRLTSWVRGAKMVLEANPGYRGFIWNFAPGSDPGDRKIVAAMKGKKMPQIGRIEINVLPEDQSRWLAFQNGEIDLFNLDGPLAPRALHNGKLRPELAAKGVRLSRLIEPELSHYYFNMQDPVLGGLTKEKIALRRAIAMAHNVREEISVVWNGQAIKLEYPIPPGIVGHDPKHRSSVHFDPKTANALLDKFGYKKGKDGWRMLPSGIPFTITFSVRADSTGQQQAEMWKKTFDSLAIRMQSDKRPFPDLLKAEKQCKLMMRTSPWIADYPDGDNFMQLFYGKNVGQSNNGCMKMAEFDRLYERSKKLPAGRERDLLYHKMARLIEVYAPTIIGYARYRNMLTQPHVIGYKKHPVLSNEWVYIDVERHK